MTQAIHPNRGGTGRTDAPDSMEIPIGDGAGGFDYHELVAGDGIAIDTDAEAETVTIRSTGAGTGDMLKTTYDPTNVAGDAFDMANMVEAADAKVMTAAERTKLSGVEDGATADQSDAEIETAYNNQVAVASQGEAEAGTGTTPLRWTPQRIAQAIAALQTGVLQNNFTATTNPTTTDDTNAGYSIGSVWVNVSADEAYRCVDNTASAAVWVKTTLSTDELATVATTGSYNDLGDKPTIPDDAETDINAASADTLTDTSVVPFLKAGTLVKITWANFKATLKTYFDTLYVTGVSGTPGKGSILAGDGTDSFDEVVAGSDDQIIVYDSAQAKGVKKVDLDSGINFIIDGGGSAIATGVKGDVVIPFDCTIEQVTMLADQSGSIVVDIWKDTYANFPPTDADTITASAVPTISSATKSQDSTLTGWTTALTAGDVLRYNVDSVTSVTRLTISLRVRRNF